MKSEHRHELKTNELAERLAHFPELIKRNTNTIIGVALIAAGLITWPMFNKMNQQKTLAEQSMMTQSIQGLELDIQKILCSCLYSSYILHMAFSSNHLFHSKTPSKASFTNLVVSASLL